jgi:hypothetical protein
VKTLIIIAILFLLNCVPRKIIQGEGLQFNGIAVDTIHTQKGETK